MKVTEIWRYPVKTMAGEKLQRVRLGPLGIEGDRIVHIEDAHGRVIASHALIRGSWAIRGRLVWMASHSWMADPGKARK